MSVVGYTVCVHLLLTVSGSEFDGGVYNVLILLSMWCRSCRCYWWVAMVFVVQSLLAHCCDVCYLVSGVW